MGKSKFSAVMLSLMVVTAQFPAMTLPGVAAGTAAATGHIPAEKAPIGRIESARELLINGRSRSGREAIWDGELIEVPRDSQAEVWLRSIGRVRLGGGSVVRLSTDDSISAGTAEVRRLSARLESGEVAIRLDQTAQALVIAGGGSYLAAEGAVFSLVVEGGRRKISTIEGRVVDLGEWSLRLPGLAAPAAASEVAAGSLAANPADGRLEGAALDEPLPVKLHSKAAATMIGVVESASEVMVNGRVVRGREWLWDGETVRSGRTPVQLTLSGIGKVILPGGSVMRIGTAIGGQGADRHRALVAVLTEGSAVFRVDGEARAYVRFGDESFISSPGAEFRLASRRGEPIAAVTKGSLDPTGRWRVDIVPGSAAILHEARPVTAQATPRGYLISPLSTETRARVELMTAKELSFLVTDDTSQPVPRLPVTFTLNTADGRQVGMLGSGADLADSITVLTDDKGVASVPFRAGTEAGSASISAAVDDGFVDSGRSVTVISTGSRFWTKKNAIPVLATAAAMIVAAVVVVATRTDRLPIKGSAPIQIIP